MIYTHIHIPTYNYVSLSVHMQTARRRQLYKRPRKLIDKCYLYDSQSVAQAQRVCVVNGILDVLQCRIKFSKDFQKCIFFWLPT